MSVMEIFEVLKNNNMSIGLADGKLKVADPHQKLTPALRDQIKHSKDELMRVLSKRDSFVVSDFPQATMSDAEFQEIKQAYPGFQDIYVASPLQKGMFFGETLAGSETSYSRQIVFDMEGQVDAGALKQAWEQVIARHAIFRTCFVGFGTNEIHQLVAKQSEIEVNIIDKPADADDEDRWLDQFHAAQRAARFDYGRPALMRVALVKLSATRLHFACTYHHAILDGWSIPLLLDEVNQSYQAILEGGTAMLPSSVPYSQYIGWLASQDQDAAQAYWNGYLAGHLPPARPHFDAPAGNLGGGRRLDIDPALGAQLVAYCAEQRCTMTAMLHLAWSYTLGRFLNQDDIVVGSVSSVRPAEIAHVERMLGMLVNTVPVRVKFDPALTVAQGLATLSRHSAESADYRYFALDKIQSALGFSSKLPLFESLLVFQNYPDYGKNDGDELTKNVTLANAGYSEENTFALLLNGSLVGERLSLELAYDERVDPALSQAMADYLHLTLQRIVQAAPDAPLLTLHGAPQPAAMADAARAGAAAVKVADLIDAQARLHPRKAAITHDFATLNYQQLVEKSNKLANYLIGAGVRQNDVVAIMLDRSLELVVTMLAVAKAGAAYLLLDASEPDDRIGYKLAESGAPFIVSDEQGEDRFTLAGATRIIIDASKTAKEIGRANGATPVQQAGPHSGGAAQAYVNFVSVQGAYPGKVCVSQHMLSTLVAWHNGRAVAQQDKQVLCGSSVLLERCSLEVFGALSEGAQILLVDNVLDLCINPSIKPSTMAVAPDDLARLFARNYSFDGVRSVTLFDAQPSPQHLKRLVETCGVEAVDLYLSYPEHGIVAGVSRVTRENVDQAPRFQGIPGVASLAVLDLFGRSQPAGAVGQLYIGGQAQLHATGDSASIGSDGTVTVLEKSDAHTDLAGYRAAFAEIEGHIANIDMVNDNVVMMRDDDDESGERLVAYLVYKDGFTGSPSNYAEDPQYFEEVHRCKKYLLGKLPVALVPETYVFMEELPRKANGSVDRSKLPSPNDISNERRNFVGPKNAIEEALVILWEGSFLLNDISCEDDYFELGGSSLLQVKLGARINKDFKTAIPLSDLFRDSTSIASQAEVIRLAVEAKG